MPDRDRISLNIRYPATYREICEQQDPATVAIDAVARIDRQVKNHGQRKIDGV